MKNRIQVIQFVGLWALLAGTTGCTGYNQFASTIDMKVSHVAESGAPEFEGRLDSMQKVGALTSIKFANGGPMYDVAEVPAGLLHGDIIRIYKTKKGYSAHLWQRPETSTVTEIPQHQPNRRSGS